MKTRRIKARTGEEGAERKQQEMQRNEMERKGRQEWRRTGVQRNGGEENNNKDNTRKERKRELKRQERKEGAGTERRIDRTSIGLRGQLAQTSWSTCFEGRGRGRKDKSRLGSQRKDQKGTRTYRNNVKKLENKRYTRRRTE